MSIRASSTSYLWMLVMLLGASISFGIHQWLEREQWHALINELEHRSEIKLAIVRQHIQQQVDLGLASLAFLENVNSLDPESSQRVAEKLILLHPKVVGSIALLRVRGARIENVAMASVTGAHQLDPMPQFNDFPDAVENVHASPVRTRNGTLKLRLFIPSQTSPGQWAIIDIMPERLLEAGISSLAPAGLDVDIYTRLHGKEILLLHHVSRTRDLSRSTLVPSPSWHGDFEVAGAYFTVHTRAAPHLINEFDSSYPLLTLLMGLFISSLLAALMHQRTRFIEQLQKEVDEQTAAVRLYQRIYEASIDAIAILSPNHIYQQQNKAHAQLLGYPDEELYGQSLDLQLNEPDRQRVRAALEQSSHFRGVVEYHSRDGRRLDIDLAIFAIGDSRTPSCFVAIKRDVTERKRVEAQLKWLSYYDELTNLPNRRLLADRLELAIRLARREKHSLALLYLDLDRFKFINDSLGHGFGDRVLQEVAARMCAILRESDTAARMGGDEFTVLLPEADSEAAIQVSLRIARAIREPIDIDGQSLSIDSSIGIALFPDDGQDAETLLRHADTAMYHAKRQGETAHLFSASMAADSAMRLKMEQALGKACDSNAFSLVYQTRHSLLSPECGHTTSASDCQILGVEALIRWEHPEWGAIPPSKFIPLAEETGRIRTITQLVLGAASRQAVAWEHKGLRPPTIGINLSAVQLVQQGLAEDILETITANGAKPDWFEIEITETAIMHDPKLAVCIMEQLVAAGISIAIDDFGTGYSSLAYLKRLPAQWLKIDRSFVRGITTDEEDRAIVRAITALAHSLEMKVVAEGVETEDQVLVLRAEGCDTAQGYLFSRPLPADELETLFRRCRSVHAS